MNPTKTNSLPRQSGARRISASLLTDAHRFDCQCFIVPARVLKRFAADKKLSAHECEIHHCGASDSSE